MYTGEKHIKIPHLMRPDMKVLHKKYGAVPNTVLHHIFRFKVFSEKYFSLTFLVKQKTTVFVKDKQIGVNIRYFLS